jgi:hypothetical protein
MKLYQLSPLGLQLQWVLAGQLPSLCGGLGADLRHSVDFGVLLCRVVFV